VAGMKAVRASNNRDAASALSDEDRSKELFVETQRARAICYMLPLRPRFFESHTDLR
jgi:hypothetical protein